MQDTALQMRTLNARIQVNDLGLPVGIYRPDLLPAYPIRPDILDLQGSHTPSTHPAVLDVEPIAEDGIEASKPSESVPTSRTTETVEYVQGDMFGDEEDGLDYCVSTEGSDVIPKRASASDSLNGGNQVTVFQEAEEQYQRALAVYDKELTAAFVPLDYSEGYPTLDGNPFWFQFTFEPSDAYSLFEAYLGQYKTGARQLVQIMDSPLLNTLEQKPTLARLEELFHTYNWSGRAKAADMFFAAHRRKERERIAAETEDAHYLVASRMMSLCDAYLTQNGDELIETMTPKAFIEFLKTATTLQRVSIGLPANGGPSAEEKGLQGKSVDVIMRTIAHNNGHTNDGNVAENGEISGKPVTKEDKLAEILRDPRLTQMAQEVIVRLH